MKVLIACEESQVVTIAFRKIGHETYSCDLQECSGGHPEWHIKGDAIKEAYSGKYDLMVAHPSCTYLTVTANKWIKDQPKRISGALVGKERRAARDEAIIFFLKLCDAPIWKIAIENPISIMSTAYRKPDQIIQPYYFGDEARKPTCLWLKNLPLLQHAKESDWFAEKTHVSKGEIIIYKSGKTRTKWYDDMPKDQRAKVRSKTFPGIADAMAIQWGKT